MSPLMEQLHQARRLAWEAGLLDAVSAIDALIATVDAVERLT